METEREEKGEDEEEEAGLKESKIGTNPFPIPFFACIMRFQKRVID